MMVVGLWKSKPRQGSLNSTFNLMSVYSRRVAQMVFCCSPAAASLTGKFHIAMFLKFWWCFLGHHVDSGRMTIINGLAFELMPHFKWLPQIKLTRVILRSNKCHNYTLDVAYFCWAIICSHVYYNNSPEYKTEGLFHLYGAINNNASHDINRHWYSGMTSTGATISLPLDFCTLCGKLNFAA